MRPISVMAALLVAAAFVPAILLDRPASATTFTTVTITASDDDGIDLDGQSYSDAVEALEGAGDSMTLVIPSLPPLLSLTVTTAEMTKHDDEHSLAVRGNTAVFGVDAEVLVNAKWENGSSTEPEVALIFRFESIGLDTLNQDWEADEFPVELSPALVGVANKKHTVKGSEDLDTNDFFDDGLEGTKKEFEIDGSGVSLQAVVDSDLLSEATEYLGSVEGIRIRGKLAVSAAVLGGSSESSDATGLDLSADIALDTPDEAKEQGVEFDSPWTLNFKANDEGKYEASFKGAVKVDFDDGRDEPVKFTATVSIKVEDNKTTLELKGEVGEVNDLFGEEWLTLKEFKVTAKITKDDNVKFEFEMEGKLEFGPIDATAKLKIEVKDGRTSVKLDLEATSDAPLAELLAEFDVATGDIPPELSSITINNVKLHIAAEVGGDDPFKLTVALGGSTTIAPGLCNDGTFDARALVRLAYEGGGTPSLIIGAGISNLSLEQLICDMPVDWELPDMVATFATAELSETDWDELDPPTQSLFCPGGEDCPDNLSIPAGVNLRAPIDLPQDVKDLLSDELGMTVDGPVILQGTIALFGETSVSLSAEVGFTFNDRDSIVAGARVKLEIKLDTDGIEVSLGGDMTFRIVRANQDNCGPDAVPAQAGVFSTGDCYDTLKLAAKIKFEAGTSGVGLTVSGTISEWENAFGEPLLTVNRFTIAFGVGGTTSLANLTMGGSILIASADGTAEPLDLTLAISVGITASPPFITLDGITFGTARGIPVQDLVATFSPETDLQDIPNLSLKNLWFAYGTRSIEEACIREGFFLSAELHLNYEATPGDSADFDCNEEMKANPERSCSAVESCLLGVLIDIRPDFFGIEGTFPGFEAGPLKSEGLTLILHVGKDEQKFYLEGAGTLYDPVAYELNPSANHAVWASGYLLLDIEGAGGAFQLGLEGCILIGGTTTAQPSCLSDSATLLRAYVNGHIVVDFSKIGPNFLDDASASFEITLDREALERLQEWFDEQMEDAVAFFENAGEAISGTAQEAVSTLETGFCRTFPTTQGCESIQVTASAYRSAPDYISARINQTDQEIRDSAAIGLHCFGEFFVTGKTVPECRTALRDKARTDNNNFIANKGGASYIALHGVNGTGFAGYVDSLDANWYWIQPTTFNWPDGPALCAPAGELAGADNRICDAGMNELPDYDELAATVLIGVLNVVDPALAELARNEGLSFGGDTTAQAGAETSAQLFAQTATFDDVQFTKDLRTLAQRFDTGSPMGVCQASMTYQFGGAFDASPLEFKIKTDAYNVKSNLSLKLGSTGEADDLPFNRDVAMKQVVQQALTTDIEDLDCPTTAGDPSPGALSFDMSASTINEGQTLQLTNGTAPANATVIVEWGEGGNSDEVVASDTGGWSASYTYKDGPAAYFVRASVAGSTPVSQLVIVRNVAPSIDTLTLPADESDEGEIVTLSGTFSDPGVLDSHTLRVTWGDGSAPVEQTIAAADSKSIDLTHQYRDDAGGEPYTVTVRITDKDGGTTVATRQIVVNNVAPYGLTLTSVTVDGHDVPVDPETGEFMVEEGTTATYRGTFRDPGLDDEHTVFADFGDGVTPIDFGELDEGGIGVDPGAGGFAMGTTWRDDPDSDLVHFEVVYTFADDMPSGEADAVMTLIFSVDDGDGGTAEFTEAVRVLNVPPALSINIESQEVQYSDPIADIILTANDVVGYVDRDTGEWSETLNASTRWSVDGGDWSTGLPANMTFTGSGCEALGELDEFTGRFPADTRQECTWTVSGIANVAPGDYVIEFAVVDDDTGQSVTTVDITVEPEDAEANYVGPTVVSSPELHGGSMEVELRAIIRDISSVGADHVLWDQYPGDIANATVRFVDAETEELLCPEADVNYVFDGNTGVGVATCMATFVLEDGQDESTVIMRLEAGGWYTNALSEAEDTIITVQRPGGSFLTGGGFLFTSNAGAEYNADSRTDVSLGVQWGMPRYSSLRGNTRLRFEVDGHSYEIDATSYDSLGVLSVDGDAHGIGHVEARADLIDRSGRGRGTVVASDLRLQIRVTDVGSSAAIAFALWGDDGRLIIASGWTGDSFPEIPLSGGNLQAHIR